MIVHAEVFGTRLRSSIADYTIPYKSRLDLDYEFIAKKCQKVCNGIDMFDDKVHQMDSRETEGGSLLFFQIRTRQEKSVFDYGDRDGFGTL